MGKMNWIKRMIRKFTSRPKLTEEYIINTSYKDNKDVAAFIKKRCHWCKEEGIEFRLHYFPFLDTKKCGEVILYRNGEKMDGGKLYLNKGKVYFKFDE